MEETRAAKYDHIDFKPPSGVRAEAQKGLDWRSEFGRGGTAIGIARARDLSNGTTISPETARRMKAFFDRHQSDKNAEGWSPGEKGFPSNGRIAHALWGGDAGYAWSRKLVRQMEAAENRGFCPTGSGGGVDNSCASKGSGAGSSSGGGRKSKDPPGGEGGVPSGWKKDRGGDASKVYRNGNEGGAYYKGDGTSGEWVGTYTNHDAGSPKREPGTNPGPEVYGTSNSNYAGPGRKGGQYFKTRDEAISWVEDQNDIYEDSRKSRIASGKKELAPRPTRVKRSHEMQIETRSLCLDDFSDDDAFPLLKVERRCDGDCGKEEAWLIGYAARFGVNSLKMDDFYERIDPSAFSIVTERRGRKSPLETRALFNHDPNYLLGRFPNTLRMKVDEQGLRYEIKMPESRSDLVESIERGDIRGSSFSFVIAPGGEEWSVEEGRSIRTVKSIASLIDVGPVTFPAYPDASVAVARRSYDEFMRSKSAIRRVSEEASLKRREIEAFLRARGR